MLIDKLSLYRTGRCRITEPRQRLLLLAVAGIGSTERGTTCCSGWAPTLSKRPDPLPLRRPPRPCGGTPWWLVITLILHPGDGEEEATVMGGGVRSTTRCSHPHFHPRLEYPLSGTSITSNPTYSGRVLKNKNTPHSYLKKLLRRLES